MSGEREKWVRIGRICANGRRSLWARLKTHEEPTHDRTDAIELCAGREGDDAYVRIERGSIPDAMFEALDNVLGYQFWVVEGLPNEGGNIVESRAEKAATR